MGGMHGEVKNDLRASSPAPAASAPAVSAHVAETAGTPTR
jgi:hypothetical protein